MSYFLVVFLVWKNKAPSWTCFCAYPLFHRGNKNFKVKYSKKFKKEGTGRFVIERGLSKQGRIKPGRNAFTRKLWNRRILYLTFTWFHNASFFNFVYSQYAWSWFISKCLLMTELFIACSKFHFRKKFVLYGNQLANIW